MRMHRSTHGLLLAAIAASAAWVSSARAAEQSSPRDGATLVRVEQDPPRLDLRPWRGLESRYGRELTWSRWMLSDAPGTGSDDPNHEAGPWLNLADLRGDAWQARPEAASSAVSALGSVMTAGLPMLGVYRNGRVVQRHLLRGYFRSRGVSLVWRIQF
jgi:hypothetical protein